MMLFRIGARSGTFALSGVYRMAFAVIALSADTVTASPSEGRTVVTMQEIAHVTRPFGSTQRLGVRTVTVACGRSPTAQHSCTLYGTMPQHP